MALEDFCGHPLGTAVPAAREHKPRKEVNFILRWLRKTNDKLWLLVQSEFSEAVVVFSDVPGNMNGCKQQGHQNS